MRTEPISLGYINLRAEEGIKEKSQVASLPDSSAEPPKKNALPLITAAVAIASLGISAYAIKGKANKKALEEGRRLAEEAKAKAEEAASAAKREAEERIGKLEEKLTDLSGKVDSNQRWNDGYLKGVDEKISNLAGQTSHSTPVLARNTANIDGLTLIQNLDNRGDRVRLPKNVIESIQSATYRFINGKVAIPVLAAGAAVWLPTAESKPEKEGGLAEPPVQMASNFEKELGIDSYILRPMNEIKGKSTIIEENGKYTYTFGDVSIDVEKVMDFETTAMRNGQYERQLVEVFYGYDQRNGHKKIFFRNPDFFESPAHEGKGGLYNDSLTAKEPERYNFFSKIVYEFAKIKTDPKSATHYKVYNKNLLKSIKAPDTMVLNDWHTAPIAALMRLKAPAEASQKELDSKAAEKFASMNLLYIAHNSDYQGANWEHASDMLNTLFDRYTYDIYKFAETGFQETYLDEHGDEQKRELTSLRKVLTINGGVNMANMAMALATRVKPVSPTYGWEMANEIERGHALTYISAQRLAAGTMVGQSNGWDRSVNELNSKNLDSHNNGLNKDKFIILLYTIDNLIGLTNEQTQQIEKVKEETLKENKGNINTKNFEVLIDELRKLDIEPLNEALAQLKESGVTKLRSFETVTVDMSIDEIIESKKHNKRMLLESVQSMVDFSKKHGEKVFNLKECEFTDISDIDPENLDSVPFYNMGVRFVTQKGVDIAAGAWENILKDWDNLYPDKPRPLILIGGEDAEGGIHRDIITSTKKRLKEKGAHLIQMDGFTPNPVWMAGSDWTNRPSRFEPDGDKMESLYRATPTVMTRTGGHIDSINDGVNGVLTEHTMKELRDQLRAEGVSDKDMEGRLTKLVIQEYTEAIKRTLDAFYDGTQQKNYVNNAIRSEQSWIQKNKDGKIIECPAIGHLRDLGYDLKQFKQISDSVTA